MAVSFSSFGQIPCDCESIRGNVGFSDYCTEYLDDRLHPTEKSKAVFKHYVYYKEGVRLWQFLLLRLYRNSTIKAGGKIFHDSDTVPLLNGLYEILDKRDRKYLDLLYEHGRLKKMVNRDAGILDADKRGEKVIEITEYDYSMKPFGFHFTEFDRGGGLRQNLICRQEAGAYRCYQSEVGMSTDMSDFRGVRWEDVTRSSTVKCERDHFSAGGILKVGANIPLDSLCENPITEDKKYVSYSRITLDSASVGLVSQCRYLMTISDNILVSSRIETTGTIATEELLQQALQQWGGPDTLHGIPLYYKAEYQWFLRRSPEGGRDAIASLYVGKNLRNANLVLEGLHINYFKRYEGPYLMTNGDTAALFVENGKVFLQRTGAPIEELRYISLTELHSTGPDQLKVTFTGFRKKLRLHLQIGETTLSGKRHRGLMLLIGE